MSEADRGTVRRITLRYDDGRWMGNVVLDYDDEARRGCLYSITDYGNYAYCWTGVPKTPTKGFLAFLAMADPGYLVDKLSGGHDEARVCDVAETAKRLVERIAAPCRGDEDADYLGEAITGLWRADSLQDLWAWQAQYHNLVEADEMAECMRYRRGRYLQGYERVLIPALKRYLREVLAHEAD